MKDNKEIDELISRLRDCRNELERIRDELPENTYEKVRREINYAISGCNRANKELDDLRPMEGQMSLFDMDEDYERN